MIFSDLAINEKNPKWGACIKREEPLYTREGDIRTEFGRDYTRIIHCTAYRRLKHKTQVFFSPKSDHICTRIEHVGHVESVSYTIASYLGLNTELTKAISVGHDLGHAPFGHAGESILNSIAKDNGLEGFWHEQNGLHMVDEIELLEDNNNYRKNLDLTYAVRDGIISHCGEIDENNLFPRDEAVNLNRFKKASDFAPFTWEGCIVKIADKISYLGRDLEDALSLKILTKSQIQELLGIFKAEAKLKDISIEKINNTVLIYNFIADVCKNSSPENGIALSNDHLYLMNLIKKFNYENIYNHYRLNGYKDFADLALHSVFKTLLLAYKGDKTAVEIKKMSEYYPFVTSFLHWIEQYWDLDRGNQQERLKNKIVYKVSANKLDYVKGIIDYISGMSDQYAEQVYREIINF
ncbi:MAG: HD domain-containing protein [Bacillota bacterium]|nr:HD domain-containing protein [Bacillota bacterium]